MIDLEAINKRIEEEMEGFEKLSNEQLIMKALLCILRRGDYTVHQDGSPNSEVRALTEVLASRTDGHFI